MKELTAQRDAINLKVIERLQIEKTNIKLLADQMAEAALHIQTQGYNNFLNCRETFLSEVNRASEEYSAYICGTKNR